MSWIADYDTNGRDFPTCVHVTKTIGGMTNGATYVPIQDGKDVRAENAKLRELVRKIKNYERIGCNECQYEDSCDTDKLYDEDCAMSRDIERMELELGIKVLAMDITEHEDEPMSIPCVHRVPHSATCSLDWEECDNCGKGDKMRITDELREWAEGDTLRAGMSLRTARDQVLDIADHIDAEYESEISRAAQLLADAEKDRDFNYDQWQDCKQKVLQHNITMNELDAKIEDMKDKLEHCIELPKDADGEPIHIGDVMDGIGKYNLREVTGKVITVSFEADGLVDVAVQAWNDDDKSWHKAYLDQDASVYRHHHERTVEELLREMLLEWEDTPTSEGVNGIISEYANKLRMAGDDDE